MFNGHQPYMQELNWAGARRSPAPPPMIWAPPPVIRAPLPPNRAPVPER